MKIPVTFPDDDPPLVRLKCYEPPGLTLELDQATLCRHLLLIGGTGSGKTSILNAVLAQLLAARVNGQPVGLLILDGKQDDSVARTQKLAAEAGRSVQVLTPGGGLRYDLFGGLRTLDDVEAAARRLLLGAGQFGADNFYWTDMRLTMVDAALSLLVAHGTPAGFSFAVDFLRGWFFGVAAESKRVHQVIEHTTRILGEGGAHLPAAIRRKLQQVLDVAELWRTLESRTKSNVQSTLLAALRPLLSSRAGSLFEIADRPGFDAASVVDRGAVVVVSSNAVTEPGLTKLLFRLVKEDFYSAVQRRSGGAHPLCVLVMDEYPLAASPDDLENLQTLRSKGAAIVAATQGFLALDEALGVRTRQAIVTGFQNLLAMRSHEIEVDALLYGVMGEREVEEPFLRDPESNLIEWPPRPRKRRTVPVCPMGALARLKPFEAFVSLANGTHPPHAVWLEPRFVEVEPSPVPASPGGQNDPLAEVVARLRGGVAPPTASAAIFQLMNHVGGKLLMSLPVWLAAVDLCLPTMFPDLLVDLVTSFFRSRGVLCPGGLDTLPACWLRALPALINKRALRDCQGRIPFGLSAVSETGGALAMEFVQEQGLLRRPGEVTPLDVWRVYINLHLYPSLWQPLTRRHWRQLYATRPDLRSDLRLHASAIGGA